MSKTRFSELERLIDELHQEFVDSNYEVTDAMIADLWLIFGQNNAKNAEENFKKFQSKLNLVHTKIVGGMRDSFLDHIKTKENVISLRLEYEKSRTSSPVPAEFDPLLTIKEISKEFNTPEQTVYGWIRSEKLSRVNRANPARYYRRDVEAMLVTKGRIKTVSSRTITSEDKFNIRSEDYIKKINET